MEAAGALIRSLTGGMVPAVPVPHRADGSYDSAAQDGYAAWMARQPIAGVAPWAHTGRGLHIDRETAAHVLSSWRAALPEGKVLVAGVGARPKVRGGKRVRVTPPADPQGLTTFVIDATHEMAAEAKKGGADALLVFPPTLLKDLDDRERRIVQLHKELGDVGLPLIAFYLYEAAGGIPYSARTLDRIFALPHVAGIKVATLDSVMRYQEVAERVPPEKLLISGEDRFLGYSLMMGARSALIGLGAARPALSAALVRAHAEGHLAEFQRLSARCDRFGAVTFREPMEGYIRRMLAVLVCDGVIPVEASFDPWGPDLPAHQLQELEAALKSLA
jgi:4-hydroxy-tetrahydrodipicolinate synthase